SRFIQGATSSYASASSSSSIPSQSNRCTDKLERLFGSKKRSGTSSFRTSIVALPFLLLRRLSLGSSVAWAASKATSIPTSFNKEEILSYKIWCFLKVTVQNIIRSLRNPTAETFKGIAYTVVSIYLLRSFVDGMAARNRQKLDATSEWGRYADNPAARGQALTLLMIQITPYAIIPALLDKFSKTKREDLSKEEYESTRAHKARKRAGELFADGLLKLGPLYVKIGQILSCRENLFPDEWLVAMERLQDRVPAKSGKEAWELLYDAAPGGKTGFHKIFSDFDDVPLAAASLGQVHRATIRSNGKRVAIKLQRSRLRDIYDKDLALMKKIAATVDKFGKAGQVGGIEQSWTGIFNDAETILYREIDYRDEADNAIRFANDFGIGLGGVEIESTAKGVDGETLPSAAEWLRTPYTYGDLSSEKFLVMEYVPSIKASNIEALEKAGVTLEDREYLAECLAHSYLRQFCAHKFFSTDPHAGNLGIEVFEDGRAPRVVFYDFGQACSLAEEQAGGILDVIESIVDSDAKKSVSAFSRMGVLKDDADLEKVQAKCQQNYDEGKLKVKKRKTRKGSKYMRKVNKFADVESEKAQLDARIESAGQAKNTTETSEQVRDAEVMEYFTLQSEYAFVARALSQMDGVGKVLDPEFDFISAAAPYLVEVKGTGKYLTDEIKKKLTWVYGEEGILAKELKLFKSLGLKLPVKQ
ncbi:hypothetical protein ACHAWC_007875, partial [Mediolabrus comicus]